MPIPVQPINPTHNVNILHEDLTKCDDSFCFSINKYLMYIVIAAEKKKTKYFVQWSHTDYILTPFPVTHDMQDKIIIIQ